MLRPFDGENKIFLGIDLVEPVDRRHQKRSAGFGVLEQELDVRFLVQPGTRGDDAVFEPEPPPNTLVACDDLSDEIVLLDAPVEMRMPLRGALEEPRHAEQDQRQCHPCERHDVLLSPTSAPTTVWLYPETHEGDFAINPVPCTAQA